MGKGDLLTTIPRCAIHLSMVWTSSIRGAPVANRARSNVIRHSGIVYIGHTKSDNTSDLSFAPLPQLLILKDLD